MKLPLVLLECSEWVADDATLTEWERFESFYGRPLTLVERMMCLPPDVLADLARNAFGTRFKFDMLDAYLLVAMHAAESCRRLSLVAGQEAAA